MRALAGLLCGLLGLVPGAAAYEPDVFGTAGQVAGQVLGVGGFQVLRRQLRDLPRGGQAALGGEGVVVGLAGDLAGGAEHVRLVGGGAGNQAE
ncbi:hypothetical protein ACV33G_20600, partial [Pseudomonas aeruginosa]